MLKTNPQVWLKCGAKPVCCVMLNRKHQKDFEKLKQLQRIENSMDKVGKLGRVPIGNAMCGHN